MGQQIPVDPSLAQFPFWQSWLFVHEPPLAVLAMQLPLPSQARFEPHDVPTDAFDALQTGIPVVQLYVPGAQVVPQEAFGVQSEPPVPPVPAPAVPPVPVPPEPLAPPPRAGLAAGAGHATRAAGAGRPARASARPARAAAATGRASARPDLAGAAGGAARAGRRESRRAALTAVPARPAAAGVRSAVTHNRS